LEKRKFGSKDRDHRDRDRGDRDRDRDRDGMGSQRRRSARFILPPDTKIEYKNYPLLEKFLTDSGKIVSRRITGITGKQNRELEIAVKRARFLGILQTGIHRR